MVRFFMDEHQNALWRTAVEEKLSREARAIEGAVPMAHYTLDNAWENARERLALLEAYADPWSVRYLEALGVGAGWHCLDVGAGGGSIAEWLCRCVGPTGHVVATDIDTRFLDRLNHPNLEVRRHDITIEALPDAAFDLVHSRVVLMHLAERDRALRSMVGTLKPGGWLLVEEADAATWLPDPRLEGAELFSKGTDAFIQVLTATGVDCNYGRRLYCDVRVAGLLDVDGAGRVPVIHAATPYARFWQLTIAQLRDRIVGAGLLTDEELDRFLALHDDASFVAMGYAIMAVWGRKPS
jgi:2-polyprenyl-3-methyl-5-hydroxy-6-metoxy-1,4-benzoquinol methylase